MEERPEPGPSGPAERPACWELRSARQRGLRTAQPAGRSPPTPLRRGRERQNPSTTVTLRIRRRGFGSRRTATGFGLARTWLALAGLRSGGEVLHRVSAHKATRGPPSGGPHTPDPDRKRRASSEAHPPRSTDGSGTASPTFFERGAAEPANGAAPSGTAPTRNLPRGAEQRLRVRRGSSTADANPRRPSRAAGRSSERVARRAHGLLARSGSRRPGLSGPRLRWTDRQRRLGATLDSVVPPEGFKPKGASGAGPTATWDPRNGLSGGAKP